MSEAVPLYFAGLSKVSCFWKTQGVCLRSADWQNDLPDGRPGCADGAERRKFARQDLLN